MTQLKATSSRARLVRTMCFTRYLDLHAHKPALQYKP
jgi:hypothetical protein